MSYSEEADLAEQFARLSARIAELEERLARLESGGLPRPTASGNPVGGVSPVASDEQVAGIQAVLGRLGEAEAGQIRQELIKTGFPATLSRSDINKVLYRHTDLFGRFSSDASKPLWKLL